VDGELDTNFTEQVELNSNSGEVTGNKINVIFMGSYVTVTNKRFLFTFDLTADQLGQEIDISGLNDFYPVMDQTQYGIIYWLTSTSFQTNIYFDNDKVERDPAQRVAQKLSKQIFIREE